MINDFDGTGRNVLQKIQTIKIKQKNGSKKGEQYGTLPLWFK